MKKINCIERSDFIKNEYKEYLKSSYSFGEGKLQKLYLEELKNEELFKGPFVSMDLPFKRGNNLAGLIQEGIVCKSFETLSDINFERPLYAHQEEAIKKIASGRGAIVTTGTGSGKTESFLYPILNEILKESEKGNHSKGIRAIFLYPMNALVNDQMDRIRKILFKCPEITFGFFTGDTPETVAANYRYKYAEEHCNDEDESKRSIPDNELISRDEIRKNPPHLLFTNYSMLEYLMIRPHDYSLFQPDYINNWKYVVLDEAHTYNGALGIEISMLMRRLTGFALKKPQFILTSATLGQEGKSENDIIEFAQNLTSSQFQVADIIFSKRIHLPAAGDKYSVDGPDYVRLIESIDDENIVNDICKKYTDITGKSVAENIYELLSKDSNVYKVYNALIGGSKTFNALLGDFSGQVSKEELLSMIDLINKASKNGIELFNLKYHSFVRPLNGAYITLGKDQELSLTKTEEINGKKAFEVGNCRYCKSAFIIGSIEAGSEDGKQFLRQNQNIDVYENYGDNPFAKLDFFVVENAVEDEGQQESLNDYTVCSLCGCIYPTHNLNALKCRCGKEHEVQLLRVDDLTLPGNNIKKCPCCQHESDKGVIKKLNMGKDEGTAIISQLLYEAINTGEDETNSAKPGKIRFGSARKTEEKKQRAKQFLSFSDSRQQASFYAAFFKATFERRLQKRIIWKKIEDNNFATLGLPVLASELTSYIKEMGLFDNDLGSHKNSWITIMSELLDVDGSYSAEELGLFHFELDLSEIMSQIDEEDIKEAFGKYNIGIAEFEPLLQMIFWGFRTIPAIRYTESTLTPEEKKDALEYRRFDNYVTLKLSKTKNDVKSFIPINAGDNKIVRYVKRVCDCSSEEAKGIITQIFEQVGIEGGLLRKHETLDQYQIEARKYIVKNYKNSKYYKCNKCGKVTPYNIHNICPKDKCEGELVLIDPDEALAQNYYRKEYKTMRIERMVIKEHTAQIDRKEGKIFQDEFKKGKINILSCSTTFEMGIDIGGLENVFMRNVPPTPANYVQRAGRAGRRQDSSAYVLTYCSTGSHDYTYYTEPTKMIAGIITPPYFNVLNKKIILRHLMAASLGFFFRKYQSFYDKLENLVFEGGVERFKEYMQSRPAELIEFIDKKVIPESKYSEYHDLKWYEMISDEESYIDYFESNIKELVKEYEKAKEQALKDDELKKAEYYKRQISDLKKQNVISTLSKYCVIPKYGFPVDVVDLDVYEGGVKVQQKYNLSRDLSIAISEYAPDSEVVVDLKKYTSKYITLPKTGQFARHFFCKCGACNRVNVYVSDRSNKCKYCGEDIGSSIMEFFIEPKYGFKTGITKESVHMKPKRTYAGEVSYLGEGLKDEYVLDVEGCLRIETSTNDELLTLNKSPFCVCPVCGYSDKLPESSKMQSLVRKHKNYRQFDCNNEEMEVIRLGHSFKTDVARFIIPSLDSTTHRSFAKVLSFMYALLEGISVTFNIERRDIDGIVEPNHDLGTYDILLYDNVPGGAGHVKRLVDKDAILKSLGAAREKVAQKCCDEGTSCYNCLRNYNNQKYHELLTRQYALEIIEEIIAGIKYHE